MAEDEAATVRTLSDYREEIGLLVRQHRGRVVDTAGDSLLAEFPTATDAVSCAVDIQGSLAVRNAALTPGRRMEFRIGIHLGEVRVEGERIYGDGVNIAARLEGLAEAGGVCISATVHEQVRHKLDLGYVDLGDRTLKNIPDPVRVYRIQLRSEPKERARPSAAERKRPERLRAALVAAAAVLLLIGFGLWASWPRPLGLLIDVAGVSGLPVDPSPPEEPSIVVLPFANLSGDPEQEYFSDGITEDLTTELARNPFLFVISRNSAFTYKGKSVKVEDVGRELGVLYVLEGSVRKAGGRVRITAQLVDATSGGHLWSERYDRDLSEILALQSEISQEIQAAVGAEVRQAEFERVARRPTRSLSAAEVTWKAAYHLFRVTREDNQKARHLFERAVELDPGFAPAHAWLGGTYWTEFASGWSRDPKLLDRAEELGRRAIALDPLHPMGYVTVGWAHHLRGELVEAIAAAERAIEVAPSFEVGHALRGVALAREGRLIEATRSMRRALRLSPRSPLPGVLMSVAYVNFAAGRREEGVDFLERARAASRDNLLPRVGLAAYYEQEGQHAKAAAVVQEMLRVVPDLTAERAMELIPGLEGAISSEELAQYPDTLRKAGLAKEAPAAEDFTVPGFGGAPAIAVLAFDNLSGDPEQEYFADGIAEALITRLSAWRSFPVIARNSSFTYKGKAVDVKQVSRELGARYIVEGSVRRAGGRVRISAQLIDATTGHHVWAETYDRELQDIFAVEDEIAEAIAGSLGWAVTDSEGKHAMYEDPRDLDAYQLAIRGFWHLYRVTVEDNLKARAFFERAIELNPQRPAAFAGLAATHYADSFLQWTDSPARSLAEQFRAAERCVKLDPAWGLCQWALAWAWSLMGERDKALAAAELAVELAPSSPAAHQALGLFLAVTGHPEEGIAHQQRAVRLDPLSPMQGYYLHSIALAHFAAGRYEEAVRWEERALQRNPDSWISLGTLASSYAHLGREGEARSAVRKMMESNPEASAEGFARIFSVADAAFTEAFLGGLRKAGLEE
jgi:adenylate cyclase